MSNFHKLLGELKALYPIEADRGKAFEHVCQWFLENDGDYRDLFQTVWMWNEWPDRPKHGFGQDIGIDLVAKTYNGELWAIQSKFYQDTLPTADIDSFLATSGSKLFSRRMLISTSNLSPNGIKKLQNQEKSVVCLFPADLNTRALNWMDWLYPESWNTATNDPGKKPGTLGRIWGNIARGAYRFHIAMQGEYRGASFKESLQIYGRMLRKEGQHVWEEVPVIGSHGIATRAGRKVKEAFHAEEAKALTAEQRKLRQAEKREEANEISHIKEALPEDVDVTTATYRYGVIIAHGLRYEGFMDEDTEAALMDAAQEAVYRGADTEAIDRMAKQGLAEGTILRYLEVETRSRETDSATEKLLQKAKSDHLLEYLVESDPYTYDDVIHAEAVLRNMPEGSLRATLRSAHKEKQKKSPTE